jgi:hypothetical protein
VPSLRDWETGCPGGVEPWNKEGVGVTHVLLGVQPWSGIRPRPSDLDFGAGYDFHLNEPLAVVTGPFSSVLTSTMIS